MLCFAYFDARKNENSPFPFFPLFLERKRQTPDDINYTNRQSTWNSFKTYKCLSRLMTSLKNIPESFCGIIKTAINAEMKTLKVNFLKMLTAKIKVIQRGLF